MLGRCVADARTSRAFHIDGSRTLESGRPRVRSWGGPGQRRWSLSVGGTLDGARARVLSAAWSERSAIRIAE